MSRAGSARLIALSHLFLLLALGVFWFSYTLADPDLWGHIRFGQDMLTAGTVVQSDLYSYRSQPGFWINHEWLSEVVFAVLYNHLGISGLIGFKAIVSLAIVGLCYAHMRRFGTDGLAAIFLIALLSVPFRLGLNEIRPQLFTYLLFLLVLLALERASAGRARWLVFLPALFAAWVNLHGGVLAGAGVVGVWVAMRALQWHRLVGNRRKERLGEIARLTLLPVACGLALLVNPYRATLIGFLLRTATVPRPEISEWAPLSFSSFPGVLFLALLALAIAALVASRRNRSPEAIVIFATTVVMAISSNRHYPLFALALVVLVGEHIADVWNRRTPAAFSRVVQSRGVAFLCLATAVVFLTIAPAQFTCIRIEPFYFAFPARGVAWLRESGVHGNMAVPFDWGEYVLWHLGPRVKVSIDGRRETLYPEESYRESLDFEHGTRVWNALLKSSPTDLVLAQSGSPTTNLLSQTPGWQPVYQDEFCTLFARSGFPELSRLVDSRIPDLPPNGAGLCFPGHSRARR